MCGSGQSRCPTGGVAVGVPAERQWGLARIPAGRREAGPAEPESRRRTSRSTAPQLHLADNVYPFNEQDTYMPRRYSRSVQLTATEVLD